MSMPSWPSWRKPGSLLAAESWRLRLRTLEAMVWLVLARLLIALVPLPRWQQHFGLGGDDRPGDAAAARRCARHVDRAAGRLPLECKCLPRAMALSRILRRRKVSHRLTIAVRPLAERSGGDDLHAWVDVGGETVIGDLPGLWATLFTLPPA
jgi:Transglutaminase-like superfamily